MQSVWKKVGIGVVTGLTLLGLTSVYAQSNISYDDLQRLGYRVARQLDQQGAAMGFPPHVRAPYVSALTQEYLQAFQWLLAQGATWQQADMLASQHIAQRTQQLVAGAYQPPQRRRSLSERGMLFRPGEILSE